MEVKFKGKEIALVFHCFVGGVQNLTFVIIQQDFAGGAKCNLSDGFTLADVACNTQPCPAGKIIFLLFLLSVVKYFCV